MNDRRIPVRRHAVAQRYNVASEGEACRQLSARRAASPTSGDEWIGGSIRSSNSDAHHSQHSEISPVDTRLRCSQHRTSASVGVVFKTIKYKAANNHGSVNVNIRAHYNARPQCGEAPASRRSPFIVPAFIVYSRNMISVALQCVLKRVSLALRTLR